MKQIIKRLSLPIILAAILCAVIGYLFLSQSKESLQQPVTIYIASDMHYLSPELDTKEGFFSTPTANGDGKVIHYSPELTEAFLAQTIQEQPDVLILSGDLTLNGAAKSHTELIALLAEVQASGIQVLTIAGNHDVDGTAADYTTFDGETLLTMPSITSDEYKELYADFGLNQAISQDSSSLSYIYEPAPGLWILMLDTNCHGIGYVEDGTLNWLETQLKNAKRKGITILSVSHQNLYIHNDLLYFGYQLYNADKLQALYEKYNVAANFSGHIHIQSIIDEQVPEICTSSLAITGNQFGQIDCSPEGISYTARQADVNTWAANMGITDANLLSFNDYATWYFEEVARSQVRESLAESNYTPEEIDLLAETFAKINSAYFSGSPIDESEYKEGLALWRSQENSFFIDYIETMLESGQKNNLSIEIQ